MLAQHRGVELAVCSHQNDSRRNTAGFASCARGRAPRQAAAEWPSRNCGIAEWRNFSGTPSRIRTELGITRFLFCSFSDTRTAACPIPSEQAYKPTNLIRTCETKPPSAKGRTNTRHPIATAKTKSIISWAPSLGPKSIFNELRKHNHAQNQHARG